MQITSFFAGRRATVTPRDTISASQRIGAPASKARARGGDEIIRENKVLRCLDHAAGMDHAHRDIGFLVRESLEVGLRTNDREGPFVDRVAVVDIVVCCHFLFCPKAFPSAENPIL